MSTVRRFPSAIMVLVTAFTTAACDESAPSMTEPAVESAALLHSISQRAQHQMVLAQLRRATARYHNVAAALADGYIQVGGCEAHEGEAPGGIPFAQLDYLLDGAIDPAKPDALLYERSGNGRLSLVGVELAVPYPLWSASDPPQFLGETFREEDDMGVFGLHIWLWRNNPDGLFAWGNPRVSCEEEE